MAIKEEHLALSSGVGLAGFVVQNYWDYGNEAIDCFKEEILGSILKPNKTTAIHHVLSFFQDISEALDMMWKNGDDMERVYDHIIRTLEEVNLHPDIPEPDFSNCNDKGHWDCECNKIIHQWIDYVSENNVEIDRLIVHAAFQFIFQDRNFLHNFHLDLAELIENEMEYLKEEYPEFITQKGRIRRQRFPEWLKKAVFYRDKGTCMNCRCDLTNLIRNQNTIHIDHMVPLDLYGSNDASNYQLLCEPCNTSKGARLTGTSLITTPFWNLEIED